MQVCGQLHALADLLLGNNHRYPFYRKMISPHSRSGRYGEEKNFLPLPAIELLISSPYPVAVLTELWRDHPET
jgi:hypothetical protein